MLHLKVAQEVQPTDYLVTELSSFQLLGIEKYKPHIAIITNIYSAHLDYHENLENYQMLKAIYKNQTEEDYLICNYHQRQVIESEELKLRHCISQLNKKLMVFILKMVLSFIKVFALLTLKI